MKLRANRRPGNRPMTRAERIYVDRVKRAGCICCLARGFALDPAMECPVAEGHHLLEGGIRRGHLFVLGLCQWHHRGVLYVQGWDKAKHRLFLGPSLFWEGRQFRIIFGSDDELLQQQRELVRI